MKFAVLIRLFLALAVSSVCVYSEPPALDGEAREGGKERRGGQRMAEMTHEERVKRISAMVERNVTDMAKALEIRADQQAPFIETQAKYELEALKIRSRIQQAGKDRAKRTKIQKDMQKLNRDTQKAMKAILDKDQFKIFRAKIQERMSGKAAGPRGGGGTVRKGG